MALQTTMFGKLNLGSIGTKVLKKEAAPAKKAAPAPPAPKKAKTSPVKKVAAPVKKAAAPVKKAAKSVSSGLRAGGVGYRKYEGRPLWLPNAEVPAYLDGSLPGDRGFDPLGLAKPVEYLQFDVDSLDQNKDNNKAGQVVGSFVPEVDKVDSSNSLQPYSEVFGLARFRECELIHGRWAMLATLGCIVAESNTGVSWVDAGKVELDGASYFGFDLPFSLTQICWIEAILMFGVEFFRNTETDLEKRLYPGGYFDPLGFAKDAERADRLKEAEIKHARLAMVAFFGFGVQALSTGEGVLGSLAKFSETL